MIEGLPDFLFVCIGPNCGERGGRDLVKTWKAILLDEGRWDQCRVVPANCFGQCATGPNACSLRSARFVAGIDPHRATETLADLTMTSSRSA